MALLSQQDFLRGGKKAVRCFLRIPLQVLHALQGLTADIKNGARTFIVAKHRNSFISMDNIDHLLTRCVDTDDAAVIRSTLIGRYLVSEP